MKKILVFLVMMVVGASYADTETVNWYKDGAVYDTTTCQTGGDITVPTAPTKRGYVFNGWVFVYDFSTLDASILGDSTTSNNSTKTWTITFSYGTIYGKSMCSTDGGSSGGLKDVLSEEVDRNCWCKVTGYKPTDFTQVYESVHSLKWMFVGHINNASQCSGMCATQCAARIVNNSSYLRNLFGITQ